MVPTLMWREILCACERAKTLKTSWHEQRTRLSPSSQGMGDDGIRCYEVFGFAFFRCTYLVASLSRTLTPRLLYTPPHGIYACSFCSIFSYGCPLHFQPLNGRKWWHITVQLRLWVCKVVSKFATRALNDPYTPKRLYKVFIYLIMETRMTNIDQSREPRTPSKHITRCTLSAIEVSIPTVCSR
jgi:hypothetical protein